MKQRTYDSASTYIFLTYIFSYKSVTAEDCDGIPAWGGPRGQTPRWSRLLTPFAPGEGPPSLPLPQHRPSPITGRLTIAMDKP